jgi:hypothetical protein
MMAESEGQKGYQRLLEIFHKGTISRRLMTSIYRKSTHKGIRSPVSTTVLLASEIGHSRNVHRGVKDKL